MNRAGATLIAVLMFITTLLLRHSASETLKGISITALLTMWFILAWTMRLKWGQAAMEQWRNVRQRGKLYFALVHGGWWLLFFLLFIPSFDFAMGAPIRLEHFWWQLAIGVCVGPVGHLWEWNRREQRFAEWQRRAPLPCNGVA